MKLNKLLILCSIILPLTGCATEVEESQHFHSYSTRVVSATCKEGGYTLHYCSCGDSYKTDYTNRKRTHTGTSSACTVCGLNFRTTMKSFLRNKGSYNSSHATYRLSYTASNYTSYLQYETKTDELWLAVDYSSVGMMAIRIGSPGYQYTWLFVCFGSNFYYDNVNSYSNWIMGSISPSNVTYSNRTSYIPYSNKNIVSGLEYSSCQAAHELMYIGCLSMDLTLIEKGSEVYLDNLGFTNYLS